MEKRSISQATHSERCKTSGSLRSLHEFMDRCSHTYAIRFYAGNISIDELKTRKGKLYKLLNLPYFLAAWTEQYLAWFMAK
jgi:uncharacterized protein